MTTLKDLCSAPMLGLLIAASMISGVHASDLTGNSLDLSWTEQRQVLNMKRGFVQSAPVRIHLQLYVSSKGHFFTKIDAVNRRGENKDQSVVAGEGGDNSTWQWQLNGNGVTGFGRVGRSGARRIDVTLGKGGQCAMRAHAGQESRRGGSRKMEQERQKNRYSFVPSRRHDVHGACRKRFFALSGSILRASPRLRLCAAMQQYVRGISSQHLEASDVKTPFHESSGGFVVVTGSCAC